MADPVQQIKDRLSIVDVVGTYVKLTKAGKNYKGLSPFRKEKTPSFYVNPDKGMYYDFSSGQGGDMFTFIEAMEGLDFKGALHTLADRAGVTVTAENKMVKDAREQLFAVLEDACQYFETKLQENTQAIEYLQSRGLEEATMRSFRVGFAPNDWQAVHTHLTGAGYKEADLERAGLIKKGEKGRYYDRFRSRIMFPIMDSAGRVVAFSGRIFGEAAKDDKNAKYLNSPETELFDKGRILYGYHKAKQAIRKYDFSILVEGQMDIVMSHQVGYPNTVAASGTGLTDDHLGLLDRLSKRLVMAFDADSAGIASSGRAAILALRRGMDVKVARVPRGSDPADCILENSDTWKEAVKKAVHIVDFYLEIVLTEHKEGSGDERSLALAVRDKVLPYIARIQSGVDQAHFVRRVANTLSISEESVWQDVHTHARGIHQDEARTPTPEHAAPQPATSHKALSRTEHLERELAGFLFWQETLEPLVLKEELLSARAEELEIDLAGILARYTKEKDMLSMQADIGNDEHTEPHEHLENLLVALAREQLQRERAVLTQELKEAEQLHDNERTNKLLERFREMSRLIENLAGKV